MVLSLQILGGLQARLDGEPLAARAAQRKRLALLCLLATARSRSLARDRILALLWPEYDTERARHQLAATTHDIRRAIASELLIAEADELRLNPALVECDLWDFEAALERGDAGEAVARYGGPLLDGFHVAGARELEQWIEDERARLARRFATAVEELATQAESAGELAAAAEWWRRRVVCDPFDSRVAVRLHQTDGHTQAIALEPSSMVAYTPPSCARSSKRSRTRLCFNSPSDCAHHRLLAIRRARLPTPPRRRQNRSSRCPRQIRRLADPARLHRRRRSRGVS